MLRTSNAFDRVNRHTLLTNLEQRVKYQITYSCSEYILLTYSLAIALFRFFNVGNIEEERNMFIRPMFGRETYN